MNVIRVALPNRNALTDIDPSHFSLFSDTDNILIKEFARGSGTLALSSEVTIPHNLGYIPFYMVFTEVASGRYRLNNRYNIYSEWKVRTTTSNLIIRNDYSATYTGYKYYIFYDNFT